MIDFKPDFQNRNEDELSYDFLFKNSVNIEKIDIALQKLIAARNKGRGEFLTLLTEIIQRKQFHFSDNELLFLTAISVQKMLEYSYFLEEQKNALAVIVKTIENQDDFDFELSDDQLPN